MLCVALTLSLSFTLQLLSRIYLATVSGQFIDRVWSIGGMRLAGKCASSRRRFHSCINLCLILSLNVSDVPVRLSQGSYITCNILDSLRGKYLPLYFRNIQPLAGETCSKSAQIGFYPL